MTDYSATDPRLQPGANANGPDYAKEEAARLAKEYQGLQQTLEALAEQAKKSPPIDSDEIALEKGGIIKRFRDLYSRLDNTRVVEVEPNLRRMNAANAFFNGLKKIIQPEDKKERRSSPGYIDRLQAEIDVWQEQKEARQRARLEAIRIEAERQARLAAEKLEAEKAEAKRLEDEAVERQREAERARAPAQVEKKTEVAEEASKAAGQAHGAVHGAAVAVEQTSAKAEEAYISTLAKSADLVRTRGVTEQGGGVTLTTTTTTTAELIDRKLITDADKVKLFAYLSDNEIEKAIRAFARATQYAEPMAGTSISKGKKGVTR